MFFEVERETTIEIEPKYLGRTLRQNLEAQIRRETEGKVDYQTGLTLAVTAITDLGKGRIREGVGNAVFTVKFTCLVMKPIKGEVIDAVVTHCNPGGFFCQAGPMEMFVSQWLLPEHFQYESTTEPMFTSTIAEQPPIRSGCSVRVRIVGYKVQAGKQSCIATIKDDFLGVLS